MPDVSISSSGKPGGNPTVNTWMDAITLGEKYRKTHSSEEKWPFYRDMYRGKWAAGIKPVNKIFSYGRALIPRIYFRNPRILIRPNKPEYTASAMLLETVDNWLLDVTQIKKTLKKASLHGYISGIGPIKLGYDSKFGYDPDHAVDVDSGTVTQVGKKMKGLVEYNININPGMPWAAPVMPEHIITPWGYDSIDDMPWICHVVWRPLDDLKNDSKYKNTKQLNGEILKDVSNKLINNGANYAKIYEICDFKNKERISICENTVIYKGQDILQNEGLPYEAIIFNEDPEYFWPISDCQILEPDQLELNEVRTQQSRHRAITLLKFLYKSGSIKESELNKFLSGNVGPAIAVDDDSLLNAIVTLQPHMPPELWKEAAEIIGNIRESMGFSENQVSNFAPKQNTSATEASIVQSSFEFRIDERKDIISEVLRGIVRKWNSMLFNLWDGKRVARIVGPQGEPMWVEFTGKDLEGDYTFHIDAESGFPVTAQVRREVAQGIKKEYTNDMMVDQLSLKKMHMSQFEDIIPGLQLLVTPPQPTPDQISAGMGLPPIGAQGPGAKPGEGRQPGSSGGNRGGGMHNAVEAPQSFDKFRQKVTGQK